MPIGDAASERERVENPTQVIRPWRSVLRTVIIAGLALLLMAPDLADALALEDVPEVAGVLAAAAGLQRILALRPVERWLQKYMPWLAADVYEGQRRKERNRD